MQRLKYERVPTDDRSVVFVHVLTEALLACAAPEAMEATWLMIGEKFVGPDSLS